MDELRMIFLGNPKILFNDKELKLPFTKAYGVMNCIGIEKSITRDKMCSFFWCDTDEKTAKKNLRNAVYTIRKHTCKEIIISPKRNYLEFGDQIYVTSDVDTIVNFDPSQTLSDEEILDYLEIYKGDFLTEFKYVDSEEYIDWIRYNQIKIKKLYIAKLEKCIMNLNKCENYHLAELCCEKLIRIDEYEELGYQLLMEIYEQRGKVNDCAKLYNKLTDILHEELFVEPSEDSKEIFNRIILNKTEKRMNNDVLLFHGRKKELKVLVDNHKKFMNNKDFASYIITGEPGIGKSRFLEEIKQYISATLSVEVICYDRESNFHFKLWDNLFQALMMKIKTLNTVIEERVLEVLGQYFVSVNEYTGNESVSHTVYSKEIVEEYVIKFFEQLSKKHKLVLFIDDIQWSDKSSIDLLEKVMFYSHQNIMLVAASRTESKSIYDEFYYTLFNLSRLQQLCLERFSVEETFEYISMRNPEIKNYSGLIHKESEGIPLFIVEIINNIKSGLSLNNLSDKLVKTIGGRIVNLNMEEKKVLSICSVFYKTFNIKMLSGIITKNDLEIAEIVEKLILSNLLKEVLNGSGQIVLDFAHQKIREYVYSQISYSKRSILHNRIAKIIEKNLVDKYSDIAFYPSLIYHYEMCDEKESLFKYKVLNLYRVLNITHEVFPVMEQNRHINYSQLYIPEIELEDEFIKIEKLYEKIMFLDHECDDYILFLLILGRYHKNKGNQTKGVNTLMNMIGLAKKQNRDELVFEGFIQLIQNSININDVESMGKYITELESVSRAMCEINFATLLIYKGYFEILNSNYLDGEKELLRAKQIFESTENREKYLLNISAIQMYMGESKSMQHEYIDAIELFSRALEICDNNEDVSSLAIILSKLGALNYSIGKKDEAMDYLTQSLNYFNKTIFIWGRVNTYYYLSKLYLEKGDIKQSVKFFEHAKKHISIYRDQPIEREMMNLQEDLTRSN